MVCRLEECASTLERDPRGLVDQDGIVVRGVSWRLDKRSGQMPGHA
jgi:hypothetical protein